MNIGLMILLLLNHLASRYPCADDCYNVLDIDLVESEEQARSEMEWCMERYNRHYTMREGDRHSNFGLKCYEARWLLASEKEAKEWATEVKLSVKDVKQVARNRLEEDWCRYTNAELLRKAFDEERERQLAKYDCDRTEQDINYPDFGLGTPRKNPVDLDCWANGWRKFYIASK